MEWLIFLFVVLAVLTGLVMSFIGAFLLIMIESAKGDHDEYLS
jgi:hypothetical protein